MRDATRFVKYYTCIRSVTSYAALVSGGGTKYTITAVSLSQFVYYTHGCIVSVSFSECQKNTHTRCMQNRSKRYTLR